MKCLSGYWQWVLWYSWLPVPLMSHRLQRLLLRLHPITPAPMERPLDSLTNEVLIPRHPMTKYGIDPIPVHHG